MFEGWLHETLANSLGRILDISKEQLRISLWSGGCSSIPSGAAVGRVGLRVRAWRNPATAAATSVRHLQPSCCRAAPCSMAHRPDPGECAAAPGCL